MKLTLPLRKLCLISFFFRFLQCTGPADKKKGRPASSLGVDPKKTIKVALLFQKLVPLYFSNAISLLDANFGTLLGRRDQMVFGGTARHGFSGWK
jgi:hypothetical protein